MVIDELLAGSFAAVLLLVAVVLAIMVVVFRER